MEYLGQVHLFATSGGIADMLGDGCEEGVALTEVFQAVSDAVRVHQVSIIAGKNMAVFCPLDFIQLFVIIRWFGSTIGWTSGCRKICANCR